MGLRVKDGGGSESRSVMGRIGPREWKYPTRKGADFRRVARHEKADGNTETGIRRLRSSHVAAGASLRKSPEIATRVLSSA